MRGGFVHNQVLLRAAEVHCRALGARVFREYGVRVEGRHGAVDLLAEFSCRRLVIEVENSPRRVVWDIDKSSALCAHALAILTPSSRIARACEHQIRRRGLPNLQASLIVCVLTQHAFHQWLENSFRLFSDPIEALPSKTIPAKNTAAPLTPGIRS